MQNQHVLPGSAAWFGVHFEIRKLLWSTSSCPLYQLFLAIQEIDALLVRPSIKVGCDAKGMLSS